MVTAALVGQHGAVTHLVFLHFVTASFALAIAKVSVMA